MPVSLTPPMTIYPNNQTFTEMLRVDRSSGEFSDLENDEAIYGGGKVTSQISRAELVVCLTRLY